MPVASGPRKFGPYHLDANERLLLRSGQPVALTPKAFDLLVYLVDHAGHLVTKHDLMTALWPDTCVEEANLAYTVSTLRKALEDGKAGVQFIQTVPTKGYRFVAGVTTATEGVSPASDVAGLPHRFGTRSLVLAALLVTILAMAVVIARQRRAPQPPSRPATLTINLPDATLATHAIPVPQIAPDGRRVALLVTSGSSISLRNVDDGISTVLAGTSGARSVFWSPDSQHLGFTTSSAVKSLRLSDGVIEVLCDRCEPAGGGTWSTKGLVAFPTVGGALFAVPARGGAVEKVTTLVTSAGEIAHRAPHFLPDGNHFLYSIQNRDVARSGLYVGQLGSGKGRLLVHGDTQAVFAEPGYILLLQAAVLVARRFDVSRLEFTSDSIPVVTAAALRNDLGGQPAFSASHTGVLTHSVVERSHAQFQWMARDGRPQELVGEPDRYYTFDLSADERRLVYARWRAGDSQLLVRDLERGVTSPVTGSSASYADPRWAEGSALIATRWLPLPQAIVMIARDGSERPAVTTRLVTMAEDVSSDGTHLLYREQHSGLLAIRLAGDATPVLVRAAPIGGVNQARFSPDGRWVAYHEATDSGRFEVYVTPFPPTGERLQLSSRGGVQPMWRQDGLELYYLSPDGALSAVSLRSGSGASFSAPTRLFPTGLVAPATNVEEYAPSSDGQRFLLLKAVEDRVRSSVSVIQNWPELLNR